MTQTQGRKEKGDALNGKQIMVRQVALIAALVVSSAPSVTFAQEAGHNRGACRADAERLCAGVEHGHGRIIECLAGQKDKLSDDCRKVVESRGK
jgi:hypothetical protein